MARCQTALKLAAVVLAVAALTYLIRIQTLYRTTVVTSRAKQERLDRSSSGETSEHSSMQQSLTAGTHHLKLPYPNYTRPLQEILGAPWVAPLQTFLRSLGTKHISVCLADSRYAESLIHWLVSALLKTQPPLQNVLVISLDKDLHDYLQIHDIDSVLVNPQTVLRRDLQLPTNFSHIWATRMVVFRLLNYWGYSVATFDTDAILLRNPQPLFNEYRTSDLIGSSGTYPFSLHREWKSSTFCMGVALFRSSQHTELFWDLVSELQPSLNRFDDQVLINSAFKHCHIHWQPPTRDGFIVGECEASGLKVTIIPNSVVCRRCVEGGQYAVWHQKTSRGQEAKKSKAEEGRKWFLRDDWRTIGHTNLRGLEWLRQIAV